MVCANITVSNTNIVDIAHIMNFFEKGIINT